MMRVLAQIVLVYTFTMLGAHLVSAWMLQRKWVSEMALLRFEAAYYVLLISYTLLARTRAVMIAVAVLAAIHVAIWAVYEMRRPAPVAADAHMTRVLIAVQVFDWAEAVVLAWIGWQVLRNTGSG